MTHITILCVTIFLHRTQAHRGLILSPILSHFMRFWLWLTTGMITKEWVAIHRKHHRHSDETGDPHSPHVYGIFKVLTQGALLYHEASKDKDMVNTYGVGTPDDWIESHVYSNHSRLGVSILLLLNLALFGWIGAIIWLVQMLWIPFWAAGVVNGVGHWAIFDGVPRRRGQTTPSRIATAPVVVLDAAKRLPAAGHCSL